MAEWQWNEKRSAAALLLAEGQTEQSIADTLEIERKSLWNWKQVPEFSAEVDRLSVMVGIASRAERLRIAMRVARQKVKEDRIDTEKDLLDWLKFAQSETDGINLNLVNQLAALAENEAPVADSRPAGDDREPASEAIQ